jgi:putative molybdopterin biosynthesis protein
MKRDNKENASMTTESELLNVQEVAGILKIARNTVYELIKRGDLGCFKVGKQMRISRDEVDAYLMRTRENKQHFSGFQPDKETTISFQRDELLKGNELIICGQDLSLDLLVTQLSSHYDGYPVYRAYLGSYNGIYALYQGKVNVATAHMWDGDTDTYNVTYVEKMMPGTPAVIIRIGERLEGFYVKRGNPKAIASWDDLKRQDLILANRECGSGVRILLDEKLRLMGVSGDAINGYANEFQTHLAVAEQVSEGLADIAIGSERTCQSVPGIDFIPLQNEFYDLIMRKSDAAKLQFRALIEIVSSHEYKRALQTIAGFNTAQTGRIISG